MHVTWFSKIWMPFQDNNWVWYLSGNLKFMFLLIIERIDIYIFCFSFFWCQSLSNSFFGDKWQTWSYYKESRNLAFLPIKLTWFFIANGPLKIQLTGIDLGLLDCVFQIYAKNKNYMRLAVVEYTSKAFWNRRNAFTYILGDEFP